MTTPTRWADRAVTATVSALAPLADADRAAAMTRYMRDQFPFLGVASPQRRAAQRTAWAGLDAPDPEQPAEAARLLWQLPEREYQYAACDLLQRWVAPARRAANVPPQFLVEQVQPLLTTKSWWDSVDALRGAAVGPLVAAHPELVAVIRSWIEDDDRWLVRSALIHQLGYRERTDQRLLFELCARRAGDREFFIAKAIGWALRTHARRRPDDVRAFCSAHPELGPLARREALKHLAAG